MIITVDIVKPVLKLMVKASKPTLGAVICLLKRADDTIQHGVNRPNTTAIHFGKSGSY